VPEEEEEDEVMC